MDKNAILVALSQSNRTALGRDSFIAQSGPQRVFSSIWALEAEVNNGGFSQYFFNDSRETAGYVVEALKSVGARQTAVLCTQAIDTAFPAGLPSDLAAIRSVATNFSEETEAKLNDLDRQFYLYPDNLTQLLYAYVAAHPEEFGEVPHDAAAQ